VTVTGIRAARPDERATVAGILDGAALAVDHEALPDRLAAGDVLVASEADRLVGALVLDRAAGERDDTSRIEAVAVRPGRRAQGVGTALVSEAVTRCDRLVAECDVDVRPLYEDLGFDVAPIGAARYRCVIGSTPEG
jgi:GNAT superfamily N-acetyltransferase